MDKDFAITVSGGHFRKLRALNRRKNYLMKRVKLDLKLQFAKIRWDKYKKNTLDLASVKTILLLRNEGTIGDMVVYSSLISSLHKAGYIVDILLTKSSSTVMEYNPWVRDIYEADDTSTEVYIKSFNHTVPESTIKTLNNNHYDLVIDPSLFDTPVHRMKLLHDINPRSVLAFNKRKRFKHYSKSLSFRERDREHVTQAASLIAEFLESDSIIGRTYELYLPATFIEEVKNFFNTLKHNKKIIINIYTGSKERDFSQEQLSEIIRDLNEAYDDIDIILLDRRKEITLPLPENVVINPFETLHHVMALIHECHLVISPDTAIVHISAAWKKPLISVYKNIIDNNDLWAPGYDNASQIIVNNRSISQEKQVPELIIQEIKRRHLLD
ncbi:glycosyltransferase family 9 protein [Pseudomonas graminis]